MGKEVVGHFAKTVLMADFSAVTPQTDAVKPTSSESASRALENFFNLDELDDFIDE